ncbi:hypothetical protein SLA2020_175310 [Shorea laevis]
MLAVRGFVVVLFKAISLCFVQKIVELKRLMVVMVMVVWQTTMAATSGEGILVVIIPRVLRVTLDFSYNVTRVWKLVGLDYLFMGWASLPPLGGA